MGWRTNHVPYSFDFLFWWIDRLYTLSSLQWGFRLLPWLTDILTWHSSVDQFSHRIPSTWELNFSLNYALKQADSKYMKLMEKYQHGPIAKFAFGVFHHWFCPFMEPSKDWTLIILLVGGTFTQMVLLNDGSAAQKLPDIPVMGPPWLRHLSSTYRLESTECYSG